MTVNAPIDSDTESETDTTQPETTEHPGHPTPPADFDPDAETVEVPDRPFHAEDDDSSYIHDYPSQLQRH